ncbi:MAG TPA: hypothetical protein VL475_07740 [Planctomycetaceae bacterium]|nr:hypothetical protein [Planctomycetaceae bacterium]
MTAHWTTGVSLTVCLLSTAITTGLACLTANRLTAADVPILLFVVGPYFALAGLAWWQRKQPVMRMALLVVIAVLSLAGVSLFGIDTWHFVNEPPNRQTQHTAVFFVPLAQWLVLFVVAPFVAAAAIAAGDRVVLPTSAQSTSRSADFTDFRRLRTTCDNLRKSE